MFLLAAWIKWFPPIARESPSPMGTMAFRLGRESLTPVAKVNALPWIVCRE